LSRVFPLLSFTAPATPELSTLSLHDALPIYWVAGNKAKLAADPRTSSTSIFQFRWVVGAPDNETALEWAKKFTLEVELVRGSARSEEHTSELQSLTNLVCRLLLEKKNRERSY